MDKKIKIFGMLVLMIVGVLALSGIASAIPADYYGSLPVDIDSVEVDDTELHESNINVLDLERGNDIEVKVTVTYDPVFYNITNPKNLEDVQIEVYMRGYDHDDLIEDITDAFDMKPGVTYSKKLTLPLRARMDQDRYSLRIRVEGKTGGSTYVDYEIEIDTARHSIDIKDIVLNPEGEIRAGRALLGTVRVKNYGEKTEEGIKIKMSIPELGVSASDYIDELESDESTTSEELYMRIPDCAKQGTYQVKVEVEFDDGDEVIKDYSTIRVVEGDTCAPIAPSTTGGATAKTIITLGIDTQDVVAGASGVVYPLTITNSGTASKAYTVNVDSAEWANIRVSPSNTVVLQPGETTSMFVYVAAKEGATSGLNMMVLTVSSGGEVLKQIPLKANVKADGAVGGIGGLKKGLEIGLVVLVILLVILGLIIGFSKLRGKDEEEESRTYY